MRLGGWLAGSVLVALLSCSAKADAHDGPDYRSHFFDEVLSPSATEWTPRFDDYQPTSYHVDKLDLARNLPAYAARRGQELRGVLVVGPVGFMWTYHVFTFVREGEHLRVVATALPHARVTGKSTAAISEADYRALNALISRVAGVAQAPSLAATARHLERRVIERNPKLGAEWQANLVFVDYREGVIFGELDETNVEAFERALESLLARLRGTYRHGDRPVGTPTRGSRSMALVLSAEVREVPLPDLNQALAAFGFGGFDHNAASIGLGFDLVSRPFLVRDVSSRAPTRLRLHFGLDMSYGQQDAEHRSVEADIALARRRLTPRVGLELLNTHGLSLLASGGVRWGFSTLTSEGPSELSFTRNGEAQREVVEAELSLGLEYYLPHSLFFGSVIGTRTGFIRPFYESPLLGAPFSAPTDTRGLFTQLYLGLCICRPTF